MSAVGWWRPACAIVLSALMADAGAQSAYRYRDASGQWVYSDHPPPGASSGETFQMEHEQQSLQPRVDAIDAGDVVNLVATNDCLCEATFELTVGGAVALPDGSHYDRTLRAGARETLVQVPKSALVATAGQLPMQWRVVFGSPRAVPQTSELYRLPYAIGSTHMVSQAYPQHMTHTTVDSVYAIDFAVPDGTPIDAAREGVVINVRHDFFRGAIDPALLDQANVVEILHDDGTIALYAHLHWDSVRVRIGEHVQRGQYIADSGNTGFTSGPHLHFAVVRNDGHDDVSIPVQFAGAAGSSVSATTGASLTAY